MGHALLFMRMLAVAGAAVAAAGGGAAATETVHSGATNVTAPHPVPQTTLLYIPMHASEPAVHLMELVADVLSPAAPPSLVGARFDILLALSGPRPPSPNRTAQLTRILRHAAARLPAPAPRVFVDAVVLPRDAYDRGAADTDAHWVAGPNTAFYDALLDGHIYTAHVARYSFVQQLETDMCAARGGWLDAVLHQARARPHALVMGAKLAGDCVWIAAHDECEKMGGGRDDGVLTGHINGNALYRVSRDLADLLSLARAALGDAEPFDLALWRAAVAVGWQGRVVGVDEAVNVGAPVDQARFCDAGYHANAAAVVLVHAPRRLRTDEVTAAASRIARGGAAVIVAASRGDVHAGLLHHAAASFADVPSVLWAAADHDVYAAAAAVAPYRVVLGDGVAVAHALQRAFKQGVSVFVTPAKAAVLDGAAFAGAIDALGSGLTVFYSKAAATARLSPPLLIPRAATSHSFAANASTLPSARLPVPLFVDAKTLLQGGNNGTRAVFVDVSGLSRSGAVKALTMSGAWRGRGVDAVRAWRKGGGRREVGRATG